MTLEVKTLHAVRYPQILNQVDRDKANGLEQLQEGDAIRDCSLPTAPFVPHFLSFNNNNNNEGTLTWIAAFTHTLTATQL